MNLPDLSGLSGVEVKPPDFNVENCFEELFNVNVNGHTEKVKSDYGKDLTYLSWSWAWAEIMKRYPDATYEVMRFEHNLPYIHDELTGYMVFTRVTIEGITREMWLPVMNSSNKAMKCMPYEYQTKNGVKTVEAATMFDINKAIMRCLTKNLAMFGLGLYIYANEDLPEADKLEQDKAKFDAIVNEIHDLYTKAGGENFDEYVRTVGLTVETYPKIKAHLLKKITDGGKKK